MAIVEEGVKDYVPDCAFLYEVVRMVLLVLSEGVTTAHKHCRELVTATTLHSGPY